jgi:hypothetical protein
MTRNFPPVTSAVLLLTGCVLLRVLNGAFPEVIPNISPLMALAYVGAMYLPRAWGWLIGPAALFVTELAFLEVNYRTDGSGQFFSAWTVVAFLVYAATYIGASAFGRWIASRKSLVKILTGSLLCSLVFYVVGNTYSFAYDLVVHLPEGYPPTFAGWWQANTTGLPGYLPTWVFLRNGAVGDLVFTVLLLLIFDRALLFGRAPVRASATAV